MVEALCEGTLSKWLEFQSRFTLCELDHAGVDLAEILTWYHEEKPPFGSGDKRKEFPDAFAAAALRAYATKLDTPIAVVSSDDDFRRFCEGDPLLQYYPNLDTLTAEIVADANDAVRAAKAKLLAQETINPLRALISADFPNRAFWHECAPADEVEDVENVVVEECSIDPDEIQVTGISEHDITVAFSAEVKFTADVEYADPDSWVNMGDGDIWYVHRCAGNVTDKAFVRGTVRVEMDDGWSKITDLRNLKIEEDYIHIRTPAPQVHEHDYDEN